MHRHHIAREDLERGDATLREDDARHLQSVLRVEAGDCVEAFDGKGNTRVMSVAELGKRHVRLVAEREVVPHAPPACRVTLVVGACKSNRMEWLVEKAVELGAWRVVIVATARSVVKGVEAREPVRWRRIAREALRQSGGVWETQIDGVDFGALCGEAAAMTQRGGKVWFGALCEGARPFRDELAASGGATECAWCVGPEGDFTPAEIAALRESGAHGVTLGERVLRTETAGLFGLCAINLWKETHHA